MSTAESAAEEPPPPSENGTAAADETAPSAVEEKMIYTVGGMPEKEPGSQRAEFGNSIQYLLSCIGYAVGLGNIWRFPALAFKHGGGAFLIPYICVALCFGLPTLYMETTIGQFTQTGPSVCFKHYVPAAQGLGWAMATISISIAIYYTVVISWASIYLVYIIMGRSWWFSSCDNYFNSKNCTVSSKCFDEITHKNTCENMTGIVSAPEDFFYGAVVRKHDSMAFGEFNWQFSIALVVCWTLTALGLVKGVKWLGRISMITATLPYVIIAILFGRGVTLENARVGIDFYLLKPDFSKIWVMETWVSAMTQCCFSISIGQGGLLALSSYNRRTHKTWRDALLISSADASMSVFGGIAVFSTLGFMTTKLGRDIGQAVENPLSLAFIAYPEAISHMPVPWLWNFLFFLMLFVLGMSTMFGLVEGFITCLVDNFPVMGRNHGKTVVGVCAVCNVIGFVFFGFQNGFHYFNIFNEYIGSLALGIGIIIELCTMTFVYGPRRFFRDVVAMHGRASNLFLAICGASGIFIKFAMFVTAPAFALAIGVSMCFGLSNTKPLEVGGWRYPYWTMIFALILATAPLLFIPFYIIRNCVRLGAVGAMSMLPSHPAIKYKLPPADGVGKFLWPPLLGEEEGEKGGEEGGESTGTAQGESTTTRQGDNTGTAPGEDTTTGGGGTTATETQAEA